MSNLKSYFYDEGLNKISCFSYQDFIKTLASFQRKGSPINVNETLFLSNYHFIFENNTSHQYFTWYELFPKLEEDLGIPVVDRHFSNFCGASTYVMVLKDSVKVNTENDTLVDIDGNVDVAPIVLEKDDELAVNEEVVIEEEVVEEPKPSIDHDTLQSFFDEDNLKQSKSDLESYVKDTYGIDLNKRLSFANMIAQLEDELK